MLNQNNFKDAVISGLGSVSVKGGGDGGSTTATYLNQTVIWEGFYGGHSAVDYRYDAGTAGEHDVCTVIVD